MKLYIKNMVSGCCKMVVKEQLESLGLDYTRVELGEVELNENISVKKYNQLNSILQKIGLELLGDRKTILVEKIRAVIMEMIHTCDTVPKKNISDFITERFNKGYSNLSALFSEVQGSTIEHYFIAQRIERTKELICYGELTLSEIAFKLNYSSVAHLSYQFKKETGLTPSHFKKMKTKKRIPLGLL